MTDFSANATRIQDTDSFLTPKKNAADESKATLVSGLGTAAAQGGETFLTHKANVFGDEYTRQTEIGLGMSEPQTSEEKSFAKQMARFDQMFKMGSVQTATVLKEAFLRDKISENPYMAGRFAQMAGKVDARYQGIENALMDMQSQLIAAQKEAADALNADRAKQIARLDTGLARLGIVPTDGMGNPVGALEDLSDTDLRRMQSIMWTANNNQRLIEEQRKVNSERLAVRGDSRADLASRQATTRYSQEQDEHRGSQIATGVRIQMMQAVQDSVRRYVNDNPGLSQEEYAKVYASQLNIYRDKFSRALNEMAANGAILTPKVLKEQDDLFKGELDYVGDLVTGPTSSASTALREAARSDAEITITANDSMRLFAIFNKMGVPLTDEARSAVNAYLSTRANAGEHVNLIEQVGQSLSKYLSDPEMSMQGMRDDSAEALAIAGTLTLAGLGDRNPEAMQRFKEKPEGFLNMLEPAAFAWGREPNARKKEAIWRASTSDTLIEGVKGLDAGFQQRAYMSLKSMISERAQTVVAPRILEQEMDFSEARDAFVLKNPGNAQYSTRLEMLNQAYRKAKKLEESVGNPSDADIILNDYLGLSFRPTTPEVATP